MERINKLRHILLPLIIAICIFIIPFFWLKPGEMDLGGDSSRLYFYDPLNYLFSSTLYSVSASGFGLETIYYFNIPFVSLLIVLKTIFGSPTLLISVFHGFSLSAGFIFVYLIIKELVGEKEEETDINLSQYASVLGGILYALSPALIGGWEHVLLTRNQVFLNPLIFYLLLKYFKTSNLKYIFITILLTFMFSPNFSIISAPPIFAFYPISILFLILYTKLVLKRKILLSHFALGVLLFLGVQAFHLIPQIDSVFTSISPGNDINSTIFSNSFKYDRGLSFFSAIAPNIKASINLLGFSQNEKQGFSSGIFIIFPLLIILSLVFNKKRTILLTMFFSIVTLFFATANITHVWLWVYKNFFSIPGFSMFRNFYGQWQFVYIFFYSILFGQALYVILNKLSKKSVYLLLIILALILVVNARPFIVGELVRRPLWQSNNVLEVMRMDPAYEEILVFIRSLPADARVLTLPMTDPSYQIVAGVNGGAYMGPSTIAYLAGKKDIAGFAEFEEYKSLILEFVNNQQFEELKRLLGFLGVKYIFYNADPNVYDKFPAFPYQQVRKFMPKNQNSYDEFVKNLGFKQIKNINDKYYIFELQSDDYLPQIYVANRTQYLNKPFNEIKVPLSINGQERRIAVDNNYKSIPKSYSIKFDEILIDIQDNNSFQDFFVNADHSVGFPYAFSAWPTDSLFYPFVVLRENLRLLKLKLMDDYIETAILIADKRICELEKWGNNVLVLGNVKSIDVLDQSWQEPSMWEALIKRNKYNYWEIGLLRYKRQIDHLIDVIEKPNNSSYSPITNKEKLEKAVAADRERFYTIIEEDKKLSNRNKIYLLKLCMGMFDLIANRLQLKIPLPEEVFYDLNNLDKGEYEVLIYKKSFGNVDQSNLQITINDRRLYLEDFQQDDNWYRGQKVTIKDAGDNILTFLPGQSMNLLSKDQWKLSEENNSEGSFVLLSIESSNLPNSNGLIKQINNWSSDSYYMLSFEYLTYGKSFEIVAYDKSLQEDSSFKRIFDDNLRSVEWKSYANILKSSGYASLALLQIMKSERRNLMDMIGTENKNSKIEIRNILITEIANPKIVLKKIVTSSSQNKKLPEITFTKINSTKYEIKVKNAISPYTLVFLESFNDRWRLVDLDSKTGMISISGYLSRFFASMGNVVGNMFKIGEVKKNGVINYFDGDVKENFSRNVFLDGNTFDSWGKNEIASDKHVAVNGYFNAWQIKPADVDGKAEYTLVLELETQKLFYISMFLSILTVMLCVVLLIAKLFKRTRDEK